MKIYFVGGQYKGCWYVRCLLPMIENGWKGNYVGLGDSAKPVELVAAEMRDADIIVFHRANTNWHHRIAMELQKMGKIIVFDNDDTYQLDEFHPFFNLDDRGFEENKEKINNVINNFIRNSDLVTCSTEYLAKEYREINQNVVVLPNCVNPDDWDTPLRNEGEKIRIGIVGSTAYHHDFERIKDVLTKLDQDPRVQLVMMGLVKKTSDNPKISEVYDDEYSFWESLKNLEHMAWVPMDEYFDTLNELRLDMMLIPRRENNFNKAKSNIKFLEAAMLEIPVIAQSFPDGPYEEIEHDVNGMLITNDGQWMQCIEKMMSKVVRDRISKAAKEYVLKNYNIKDKAYLWKETYKQIYEKYTNN